MKNEETYGNLQKTHVNELCADLDSLVHHFTDVSLNFGRSFVAETGESLNEHKLVPRMALDISGERFDRGTGACNVVDGNDAPPGESDKIKRVVRKGEQRVKETQLPERILPRCPEACYGMRHVGDVARRVEKDANKEFKSGGVYTRTLESVKCDHSSSPVDRGRLQRDK